MCIRLHGIHPTTTMLDPFLGIGHSALAAEACALHRFIGFDIDPEYIAEARARLGL
jgi:DNA modification methylase